MEKKELLPPNHRRSISTMSQIVEQEVNTIIDLLRRNRMDDVSVSVSERYNDEQRRRMLEKITALKKYNEEFFKEFNLQQMSFAESQLVRSKAVYLWTVLMDSKSRKLRGYGKLSSQLASALDEHIERMLLLLDEFSKNI